MDEASAIAMYNTLPENEKIWIGIKLLTINGDRIFQVIFKNRFIDLLFFNSNYGNTHYLVGENI